VWVCGDGGGGALLVDMCPPLRLLCVVALAVVAASVWLLPLILLLCVCRLGLGVAGGGWLGGGSGCW
jgi:hypothetical protein